MSGSVFIFAFRACLAAGRILPDFHINSGLGRGSADCKPPCCRRLRWRGWYNARSTNFLLRGDVMAELPEKLKVLSDKIKNLLAEEQWNECINTCTEFLRLAESETAVPSTVKAEVHEFLGDAHWGKGDLDSAFASGDAHWGKDDLDSAFASYNQAVKLNPRYLTAYYKRGLARALKKDFVNAFKDLRHAVEHVQGFARLDAPSHIASKVQSAEIFEHLLKIWMTVMGIKTALICSPSQSPKSVFHYTSLNTLQKLAGMGKFRLYNADYMNDSEEGEAFWKIMKEISEEICVHGFREKIYPNKNEESLSPVYIGSFVRMNESRKHDPNDGELTLWRTYGKNAGVEAAGACLHFDISQFAERPTQSFDGMPSPPEESMYKVVYANGGAPTKCLDDYEGLLNIFKELAYELDRISQVQVSDLEKEVALRLTRELLDDIRFLFKADYYQDEREL